MEVKPRHLPFVRAGTLGGNKMRTEAEGHLQACALGEKEFDLYAQTEAGFNLRSGLSGPLWELGAMTPVLPKDTKSHYSTSYEKAVVQRVQRGRPLVPGSHPTSLALPVESLDSPAESRGWRIRLLIRARVAEWTSSSRSRAASSGLHMARVPVSGPPR